MEILRTWNYMGNNRFNAMAFTAGKLTIWFSYDTPVAFMVAGQPRVVSENIWSTTTGKHLNAIEPDKKKRINNEEFIKQLEWYIMFWSRDGR